MTMRDETPSSEHCSRSDPSPASESDVVSYLQDIISEVRTRKEAHTPALAEPADAVHQDPVTQRASMSNQLLDLFRNTEEPQAPDAQPTSPDEPAQNPSTFLRHYLRACADPDDRVASGLSTLDAHLGGGLGSGLHVATGGPNAPLTAFALSLIWEPMSSSRPVLFYALREGGASIWTRLVATLAPTLGFPELTLAALRSHHLDASATQDLVHIDDIIQASILPLVQLIDPLPLRRDPLDALLEDISCRVHDSREEHGRTPLVVLDDVNRLASVTPHDICAAVLERLSDSPVIECIPTLVTARGAGGSPSLATLNRVRAVFDLQSTCAPPVSKVVELTLRVLANVYTGWTGEVPLLFDTSSGFVAAGDDAPEDNEHE